MNVNFTYQVISREKRKEGANSTNITHPWSTDDFPEKEELKRMAEYFAEWTLNELQSKAPGDQDFRFRVSLKKISIFYATHEKPLQAETFPF